MMHRNRTDVDTSEKNSGCVEICREFEGDDGGGNCPWVECHLVKQTLQSSYLIALQLEQAREWAPDVVPEQTKQLVSYLVINLGILKKGTQFQIVQKTSFRSIGSTTQFL